MRSASSYALNPAERSATGIDVAAPAGTVVCTRVKLLLFNWISVNLFGLSESEYIVGIFAALFEAGESLTLTISYVPLNICVVTAPETFVVLSTEAFARSITVMLSRVPLLSDDCPI